MNDETTFQDSQFSWLELLDRWYSEHRRPLPWRNTRDPYAIWVSEVMLQQTQVNTVLKYYAPFLEAFPTLESLAKVSADDVYRLWQGMGYYQRAERLHKGSQAVIERYGGKIPEDREELITIPGVGPYMASALASIAFQKPFLAVDGNIARLFSRLYASYADVAKPETLQVIREFGNQCMTVAKEKGLLPGEVNQACMDLASINCKPRQPFCLICPLIEACQSFAKRVVGKIPVKTIRNTHKQAWLEAAIIEYQGKVLMKKRSAKGLLAGLWGFPLAERRPNSIPGTSIDDLVKKSLQTSQDFAPHFLGQARHTFTHREWIMDVYRYQIPDDLKIPQIKNSTWVDADTMGEIAIPVAFQKVWDIARPEDTPRPMPLFETFQPRKIEVVAAIISDNQDRVLIAQRPDGKKMPNLWEFPGGKVDPGESHAQALIREIREELSMEIQVERLTAQFIHHYPLETVHLFFYRCRPQNLEFSLHEHQKAEWVKPERMKKFRFLPADKSIVEWVQWSSAPEH